MEGPLAHGLRAVALTASLGMGLSACATAHVDNPTVTAPPSLSYTATASGGPGALPNPCTLADPAAIRRAFGGGVSAGENPASATRQECDWTVTGSATFGSGKVVIYYPAAQSSAAFHAAKAGSATARGVTGLGDEAYSESAIDALTVLVGERQFVIQGEFPAVLPTSGAATVAAALPGLAKAAANRL